MNSYKRKGAKHILVQFLPQNIKFSMISYDCNSLLSWPSTASTLKVTIHSRHSSRNCYAYHEIRSYNPCAKDTQLATCPLSYNLQDSLIGLQSANGAAPRYIRDLLNNQTSSPMLRSSSQQLLATPIARLQTHGERDFAVAAPNLWKTIPFDLRSSDSIGVRQLVIVTALS